VGLGIDESTAVLINPDESFTVMGDSLVTVMDARKASTETLPDGSYVYQNVSVSLLAPGTTFKLP
jgi:cyanophycinase